MTGAFFLSGAGNDFVALAEPAADPPAEHIRAWCRRGLSAGADGVFVLRRRGSGRIVMTHYNADGGEADLCINGARCAARLAFELGWAQQDVEVETGAGVLGARRLGDEEVRLAVPPPAAEPEPVEVEAAGRSWRGWRILVGVPHFVVLWPADLATAPLDTAGPPLRSHPAFGPQGSNVDFARFPATDHLEIRSYERGVEGETLACGTGVLAAAACGLVAGIASLPLRALTRGGFVLRVEGEGTPQRLPASWSLAGDARLIWSGHLAAGAAALPRPPDWT